MGELSAECLLNRKQAYLTKSPFESTSDTESGEVVLLGRICPSEGQADMNRTVEELVMRDTEVQKGEDSRSIHFGGSLKAYAGNCCLSRKTPKVRRKGTSGADIVEILGRRVLETLLK